MEEGSETDVPSDEIGLIVGEPAQFRFFSSSTRKSDRPGDLLSSWSPDELEETDSLEATLPAAEGIAGDYVPVRFRSRITELGVLELWCVSTNNSGQLEARVQRAGGVTYTTAAVRMRSSVACAGSGRWPVWKNVQLPPVDVASSNASSTRASICSVVSV